MKTTRDKQTETEDGRMESHLVNSTPETSFSELLVFDPSSTQHKSRLYHWCKSQWPVFCKSLHHRNSIYYHECCNSFSRRHFYQLAGHPSLQTSTLVTIPSFKEVATSDDLFRWMLKMLTFNTRNGHQCYFPTINRYHVDQDHKVGHKVGLEDEEEPTIYLKKRLLELNKELRGAQDRLCEVQAENKRLVQSSMNWYQKYQEVIEADKIPLEFQTPQKAARNYTFFDDN